MVDRENGRMMGKPTENYGKMRILAMCPQVLLIGHRS
jgi:hypothetical protein